MTATRRHGHYIRRGGRHIRLTAAVAAPGNHRKIGQQRQAMVGTRRNGDHILQSTPQFDSANVIVDIDAEVLRHESILNDL